MDRRDIILISVAVLALVAAALSSPEGLLRALDGSGGGSKIQPALGEMLSGDVEVPIIIVFQSGGEADVSDLDIKYRYHLIDAVAGTAHPSTIRDLAEEENVQGIYLDGKATLAAPASTAFGEDFIWPAGMVDADDLWAKGIDGTGIVIAVIDSGIDKAHPDLAGKVVGEKNFVDGESTTDDLLGHGTMVAGLIAGTGAASGGKYKGVAPGASLLNVRVIDASGNGHVSDIIAGIEWALDNGADILSLSLAGLNLGETNPPVTMAADNAMSAGAVVCVAAGNSG